MMIFALIGITIGLAFVIAGCLGIFFKYVDEQDNYISFPKEVHDDKSRKDENIGQTNIRSIRFR